MLPNYTFFTIGFACCWLIFYSLMLVYAVGVDHTNYVVLSRKDLIKTISIFPVLIGFLSYLFVIRFLRRNYSFDVIAFYNYLRDKAALLGIADLILIVLLLVLLLVFWLLALTLFYLYVKRAAVKLFVYFYQYPFLRTICTRTFILRTDYYLFLRLRVRKFTDSPRVYHIVKTIWPRATYKMEKLLFFGLMPSLIIYDFCMQNGVLSKVFYVLPWFFIYSLIRTSFITLVFLDKDHNTDMTYKIYGYR